MDHAASGANRRRVGFLHFASAQEFLRSERPDAPGCLVLDVRLPGLSGLDLQGELTTARIALPVIFVTGHGDIPMSVRAMKAGAVEFLTKPHREQELLEAIQRGIEQNRPRGNSDRSCRSCRIGMSF
jgi:FixJ family two-component response regulator